MFDPRSRQLFSYGLCLVSLWTFTGCSPSPPAVHTATETNQWITLSPLDLSLARTASPTVAGDGARQREGLATIVQELDAVTQLVEVVRQMPAEPGALHINFARIQADLAAVRYGLVEAIWRSESEVGDYPIVGQGYQQ